MECVVKKYCLSAETRGMCRKCKEYDKFERKKSKSRQAIGRSNKRRGKSLNRNYSSTSRGITLKRVL